MKCALSMSTMLLCLCSLSPAQAPAPTTRTAYVNDFENAEVGNVPEDMLVVAGQFAVRKEGGSAFLELSGAPVNSFGVLLGPENTADAICGARILATRTGKRFPEFGIGLAGASGYRLWLMPAVSELQLLQNDDVMAAIPYTWTSGTWTMLRLQLRKLADGKWKLEGKAWQQGQPEPPGSMISLDQTEAPGNGRASLWGTPYSETPIRFDDIIVRQPPQPAR